MSTEVDILTSLEMIVGELVVDRPVGDGGGDIRAALGGVEVLVEEGGSDLALGGSGEIRSAGTVAADLIASATLGIGDLISDYDLANGDVHLLDLTALFETVSAGTSELGAVPSASGIQDGDKNGGAVGPWLALGATTTVGSVITILYDDGSSHSTNMV